MKENWLFGIDIGGTTTKIALVTNNGDLSEKCVIPTPETDDGTFLAVSVTETIEKLLVKHHLSKDSVAGIGVGAPGPVDQRAGTFYELTNLNWDDHFPMREILQTSTGLPVIINNDANCAALGEMWKGAGMGSRDLICLTLGTGIGGGVIVNGNIVQGARGAAGEIGHFPSVVTDGAPCNCGKTGCLETVASATGMVRLAAERVNDKQDRSKKLTSLLNINGSLSAKEIFELAGMGDETALEVVTEAAQYLGVACASMANMLNPEKIILGGGVAKAGDLLLHPVKRTYAKHAFPASASATEITLARLGNDAGAIGAAWMIKQQKAEEIC